MLSSDSVDGFKEYAIISHVLSRYTRYILRRWYNYDLSVRMNSLISTHRRESNIKEEMDSFDEFKWRSFAFCTTKSTIKHCNTLVVVVRHSSDVTSTASTTWRYLLIVIVIITVFQNYSNIDQFCDDGNGQMGDGRANHPKLVYITPLHLNRGNNNYNNDHCQHHVGSFWEQ